MSHQKDIKSNLNDNAESAVASDYIRFIVGFGIFILWIFLVVIPISLITEVDGAAGAIMRLAFMILGVAVCYWLLYSERGPGLGGVVKALKSLLSPVINMPERIRMFLMLPVFIAVLIYFLFTFGWLVLSDEASQKRALYNAWDRASTVQWFHHGDSIDVFVYSETLSALHGDLIAEMTDNEIVGIKINYTDDLMALTGKDFFNMVKHDIRHAGIGNVESVKGSAKIGVYKNTGGALDFVIYRGIFGNDGHGYLQIVMMVFLLLICGACLVIGKTNSYTFLSFSMLFLLFGSAPSIMSPTESFIPEHIEILRHD